VGIGTASPTQKFHVRGGNGNQALLDNAGERFTQLTLANNGTTKANLNFDNTNNVVEVYGASGSAMVFSPNTTERMRITSGGSIGLRCNPSQDIDSQGAFAFRNASGTVRTLFFPAETFGYLWVMSVSNNGTAGWRFENASNTNVGNIIINSGSVAYNTTSDYRLKENIAPMTGALAKVSALKPVTYKWKTDGSDGQGFIAHELAEVAPDCVSGEKDATRIVDELDADGKKIGEKIEPAYQGIDTSFLVATLTAAIQELNAKVDAQAAEIQALKGVA
jgi:hypothetical protein